MATTKFFNVGESGRGDWTTTPYDTLVGTSGNDEIIDTKGAGTIPHLIYGGDGNDTLIASALTGAVDTLYGQGGNDVLNASTLAGTAKAYLDGGADNDVLIGSANADTIYGGAGNDSILGTGGADYIDAGEGNDTIVGGGGASTILGGAGNDTVFGSAGAELITGGAGNDTIDFTGGGNDTVTFASGDGQDVLANFAAADTIRFTPAKANLTVAATDTKLTFGVAGTTDTVTLTRSDAGGSQVGAFYANGVAVNVASNTTANLDATLDGNTIFYAGTSTHADTVKAASNTGTGTYDLTDTTKYYSIEKFDNTANWFGGSVIRGTSSADTIIASQSVVASTTGDQLWGRTGDDSLVGGNGNDTFWYGKNEGNDIINNQSKDDIIRLYNVNAADVSYQVSGTDLIISIAGSTQRLTVEGWTTAANKAKIQTADRAAFTPDVTIAGTVTSSATTGATVIDLNNYAGATNIDNSDNNSGGSVLRGSNSFANKIEAADGTGMAAGSVGDQLWGRTGNDSLFGGKGNDTFWFGAGEGDDTVNGASADDVIRIYNSNLADIAATSDGTDITFATAGGARLVVAGGVAATPKLLTADMTAASKISVVNTATHNVNYVKDAIIFGQDGVTDTVTNAGLVAEKLTIDLDDAKFRSVENAIGGAALAGTVIRGTAGANKLTAATLGSQLWGRNGADTLVGAGATDTFWVGKNEGSKTVQTYTANDDILKMYNVNLADLSFSSTDATNNYVKAAVAGSTDTVTIETATTGANVFKVLTADKAVAVDVVVATYGGAATGYATGNTKYYYGGGTSDTLTGAAAVIDLTDSKIIGFENANATAASAVVRGTAGDNILEAAAAGAQLWGRAGNDTLVGAAGTAQTFWYGKDEGADVVKGVNATDSVMLYTTGMSASDVSVAVNTTTNDVTLTLGTGTLKIEGGYATMAANSMVKFGDGTSYKVSYDAGTNTYSLKA